MRRTAIRSKAAREYRKPERATLRLPLKPAEPRAVMAAANESVVAVPKDEPLRSAAYRKWVASFACFACGIAGHSQAAHSNSPIHGKGKGLKADDRYLFPLCTVRPGRVGCHAQHDLLIDMSREERREREERYVQRMHLIAAAHGWCLETLRRKG